MSNLPKSKTKIVVRIRNIKEDKKATSNNTKSSIEDKKPTSSSIKSTSSNKTNKSAVKSKKSESNENTSFLVTNEGYTIFTSIKRSNICVITNNAIKGKLIQETFQSSNEIYDYSVNLMNDSTILEFDSVYNERNKLDQLYLEEVKEPISEMLSGKNSCIMVFGPSESGKSYTFRGGDNEKGLIDRAVEDLFNFVEINQQVNQGKQNRSISTFQLKVMIYHVYNENIFDLLCSSPKPNPLKIEKSLDTEESEYNTHIIDLSEKNLKARKDLMNVVNEALKLRKNQAQVMLVNNMNKKSHFITSLVLEKVTKFNDNSSKSNEMIIEKYSQVDFVELASSEYGLDFSETIRKKLNTAEVEKKGKTDNVNKIYNDGLEDSENKGIEKAFNSICDNIIAVNNNSTPKTDTKLSLCLKPTLNKKSNIVFILCVLPNEKPPIYSSKSLKYGNWLRNQISNFESNKQNRYKNVNGNDSDVEIEPDVIEYTKESRKYNNIYKNNENNEERYKFLQDEEKTGIYNSCVNEMSDHKNSRYNYNNEYMDSKSMFRNDSDNPVSKNMRNRNRNFYEDTKGNNNANYGNDMYSRIHELESSRRSPLVERRENQSKLQQNTSPERNRLNNNNNYQMGNVSGISEMNKPINNLYTQKLNSYMTNDNEIKNKHSGTFNKLNEDQDIGKEYMIVKSDLIIYKEQNKHLIEMNDKLQAEVENLSSKINLVSAENAILIKDKIHKQQEIERLSTSLIKTGDTIFNTSFQNKEKNKFSLDAHLNLNNRIRELEASNKDLFNEKQKLEIDYKVASQRCIELKQTLDSLENTFNSLKNRQVDEMDLIEKKLERMCRELEYIQKENSSLKSNEERLKNQSSNFERKLIKKSEKHSILKENYELLLSKYRELEGRVNSEEVRRSQDMKRNKTENKKSILDEMHSKLQSFKKMCKERNKTVDE